MNRRLYYLRIAFVFVISMFAVSCSDEMHMLFPEGPQGPQGLSAYEVWVKAVEEGDVDWPKDRTDINNFFIFLKGKDGKDGSNGTNGLSAYEIWKEQVEKGLDNPHKPGTEWPKDQITLQDFWYYLSGAPGQDGVTPHIGENGNWWIGDTDTGVPARGKDGADGADGKDGKDGKDAVAPTVEIGSNGNWYINGEDTGVPARGKDGQDGSNGADGKDGKTPTITIGDNGNWFVDGEDTGVPATGPKGADGTNGSDGQDGQDGKDGKNGTQFCLGENGNWWIWDETIGEKGDWKDTGEPWKGEKGEQGDPGQNGSSGNNGSNGTNGLSAYELWVIAVGEGLENPHSKTDPKGEWPKDKTSMADFWEYLRGEDGKDGKDGEDGEIIIQTVTGKYNLKAIPDANGDYVNWNNGNVTYQLIDGSGNPVPEATVGQMPYLNDTSNGQTFTTDEEGKFGVPVTMLRSDLVNTASRVSKPGLVRLAPEPDDNLGRLLNDDEIAQTTFVPCKPEIKVEFTKVDLNSWTEDYEKERRDCKVMNICTRFKLLRKMDSQSEFEDIPSTMSAKINVTKESYDSSFQLITQSVPDLNGKTYTISSTVYPKEIQGGASIEINFQRKICNSEHFQYEGTDTYKRLGEYTRKWFRNDPDEVCYVRYAVRPQNNNSGLYGLEASSDTYFQDVPYLPSPSFIKLEVDYVTDASGSSYIPVKAYYCKGCLENHKYLNAVEYETTEKTINGRRCEVRTVKKKANYETLNCFSLFCTKIVGTNHQHDVCTSPQSWKTLDQGGYVEFNVIPGGTIGTYIPVVGQPTYWGFEVCDLQVDTQNHKISIVNKRPSILCDIELVDKYHERYQ